MRETFIDWIKLVSAEDDLFIDRIYEAAVVPELWPSVLGDISKATGCAGAVLFTNNAEQSRWTASPWLAPLFADFLRLGLMEKNPRPARFLAARHAGFLPDTEMFSGEEMDSDPVYGYLRDVGLGLATGTLINVPSGDLVAFSFERGLGAGPSDRRQIGFFDRLRPHLARSSLFASRLGLQRAHAMADAMQALGLPGGVIRRNGTLLAGNVLFEGLIPGIVLDRRSRIALSDRTADTLLAEALKQIASSDRHDAVSSIPLGATASRPPMIFHVVPIRGAAHDIFSQAAGLVVVTPVDRTKVPAARVLEGLFDLTPAEARVARGIGDAQTIEELAVSLGVSRETIRSQLKAVLAKTGTSRQAELVGLLSSANEIG